MEIATPSLDEFSRLLRAEVLRISSPNRRAFIQTILIPPYQTRLLWEYGANEPYSAWTFGDLGERDVVAQYCQGGFGALGSPWGINFRTASHFGMDPGWYRSLGELAEDWGVSE